jgi:hypothetical protein
VGGKVVVTAEQIFVFDPAGLDTEEGRRKLARHEGVAFSLLWEGWPTFLGTLPSGCQPPIQ